MRPFLSGSRLKRSLHFSPISCGPHVPSSLPSLIWLLFGQEYNFLRHPNHFVSPTTSPLCFKRCRKAHTRILIKHFMSSAKRTLASGVRIPHVALMHPDASQRCYMTQTLYWVNLACMKFFAYWKIFIRINCGSHIELMWPICGHGQQIGDYNI
jgi:hypothetical protein